MKIIIVDSQLNKIHFLYVPHREWRMNTLQLLDPASPLQTLLWLGPVSEEQELQKICYKSWRPPDTDGFTATSGR